MHIKILRCLRKEEYNFFQRGASSYLGINTLSYINVLSPFHPTLLIVLSHSHTHTHTRSPLPPSVRNGWNEGGAEAIRIFCC